MATDPLSAFVDRFAEGRSRAGFPVPELPIAPHPNLRGHRWYRLHLFYAAPDFFNTIGQIASCEARKRTTANGWNVAISLVDDNEQ